VDEPSQRNRPCPAEARLDAVGTHLAERFALSLDRRFGLVILVSLYQALDEERYLDQAEWLVSEVNRVLGRPRGIRMGEEADRDGQYFHYLAMWLFAQSVLGRYSACWSSRR
jgi:hypothetical protein